MNTPDLPALGFNEAEIDLLLGMKQSSDATFEETGCGAEISFAIESDEDGFDAAKTLAAKGYVEDDEGFQGENRYAFLTTEKFDKLMGVRCHTDWHTDPRTEAR